MGGGDVAVLAEAPAGVAGGNLTAREQHAAQGAIPICHCGHDPHSASRIEAVRSGAVPSLINQVTDNSCDEMVAQQ